MKLTPELYSLTLVATATVLMWIPYMLARILIRGPVRTLANPDSAFVPDPTWAERARRAHANAAENLVVFAPLVIVATLIGAGTPMTAAASQVYLGARLVHYIVYTAGIPIIRMLAFVAGAGVTLVITFAVLTHG